MLGTKPLEFYIAKITVSDVLKSYDFYTNVVGLKRAGPGGMELGKPSAAEMARDFLEIPLNFTGSLADPIFVLLKDNANKPTPELTKLIWVGFKVPSAREAVARAVQAGYKSTRSDPGDGPMTFGFVMDPDGYTVEFVQAPSYPEK
jgi:catechol 2,3-dioxygenase-like lactoylglutathione lyase family enzyme